MATTETHLPFVHEVDEACLATVQQIRTNWSLDPSASILPDHLHANHLPPDLLAAILDLSDLTTNQPDRAWNLLNTYFSARIREASYTGRQQSIYATLQVEDVDKAIDSTRKMLKGRELQAQALESMYDTAGPMHWPDQRFMGKGDDMQREMNEADSEPGKRKYSIRHETQPYDDSDEENAKKPKLAVKVGLQEKADVEDDGFPSLPREACMLTPTPTAPSNRPLSFSPLLPPLNSMILPPLSSCTSTPAPLPSQSTTPRPQSRPQPLNLTPSSRPPPLNLSLQIPPTPLPAHVVEAYRQSYNGFMDAARQATHQANLLRREAEMLEQRARVVRKRCKTEEGRARGLRSEAERVEGEWRRGSVSDSGL
tara:strand:- start:14035 stop:15138 length:1104 start_codon:yes stop_codon:yes gene_type:complete